MHDAIRQLLLAMKVPADIAVVLRQYGASSEEVLWGSLFALAVLLRDGGTGHDGAAIAIAAAGTVGTLQRSLAKYKVRGEDNSRIIPPVVHNLSS